MKKLFGIWEKNNVFPVEDLRRMRDTFDGRTSRGASILDNRPPSPRAQEYGPGAGRRGGTGLPSFLTDVPAQSQNPSYHDQQYQQNQSLPPSYYGQLPVYTKKCTHINEF